MKLEKWILEELEDVPVGVLADAVENGVFKSLQINDGHIVGVEEKKDGEVLHCYTR
jgi:hypothetical protein